MTQRTIPLARPSFDERELAAVRRVLESGQVVQGPEVEAFEQAIADLHGAGDCIAVSSGTAALHVCYLATAIGDGDAVFIPSFAWPSAANTAVAVGARPVFVDVLPDTYNIDPSDLRRRIETCIENEWAHPAAVVPVHEFGLAADMESVLAVAADFDLLVIEDAACALGATCGSRPVGTFGAAGIFSFHPRKAVTTGEGGAIVTDDADLADRCRQWRNHGQAVRNGVRDFAEAGLNYRMTEIQAAIGRVQLQKLPEMIEARRGLAGEYLEQLAGCPGLSLPASPSDHTWQTFMGVLGPGIHSSDVMRDIASRGVGVGKGSVAGHCQAVYAERFGCTPGDLPVSARLDAAGMALPLYQGMTADDAAYCVQTIRHVLSSSLA